MFNFFERGPKIEVESDEENSSADEESHVMDRDNRGGRNAL